MNAVRAQNLRNQQLEVKPKQAELNNRGEGQDDTRQLSESISEFLDRLPPATTPTSKIGPWIWIWNPYFHERGSPDHAAFVKRGAAILDDLVAKRSQLESENPGKAKGAITRLCTPHQLVATQEIYEIARQTGVVSGKWLLFPYAEEVHECWTKVAEATASADLGVGAKVAAMEPESFSSRNAKVRLVCVYTKDFSDKKDVDRVLKQLIKLKLVKSGSFIYYKADAMTHLEIESGNVWGIKPSLYCSADFIERPKEARKR